MPAADTDFVVPPIMSSRKPRMPTKILRPYRKHEKKDPLSWADDVINADWFSQQQPVNSEYKTKYQLSDRYRRQEPIVPQGQFAPLQYDNNPSPSVYRHDYIKVDTAKPPIHKPQGSLEFNEHQGDPISTYREEYPQFLAYQKRQAIPNRGSHWITPPDVPMKSQSTYDYCYSAHFGENRRPLMKKEVPYMPPDVELSTLTTQRADYQWNGDDLPRKPYRPQFVAAVAAPFDSESHSKSTYIPYDQSHYKAAFADLLEAQVDLGLAGSSKPNYVTNDISQIQKRRARPASPEVPQEIEAAITARTTGAFEDMQSARSKMPVSARLQSLQRLGPGKPDHATTYRRDYKD